MKRQIMETQIGCTADKKGLLKTAEARQRPQEAAASLSGDAPDQEPAVSGSPNPIPQGESPAYAALSPVDLANAPQALAHLDGTRKMPMTALRPLTLIIRHKGCPRQTLNLVIGSELIIGRERDCDVWIEDDSISRRHCRIIRAGDELLLEDLRSTNQTYLDGAQVVRPVRIKNHSLLTIGLCEIRIGFESEKR